MKTDMPTPTLSRFAKPSAERAQRPNLTAKEIATPTGRFEKGPNIFILFISCCTSSCDINYNLSILCLFRGQGLSYKQNTCEGHAEREMADKSICTHDLLDCQTKAMAENAGKYYSGQIDYKAQEAANNANLGVCFQKEQEKAAIAKCQKTAPTGKACLCSTAFLKCQMGNFKMDAEDSKAEEKRVNDLCEKAHPCAAPAPAPATPAVNKALADCTAKCSGDMAAKAACSAKCGQDHAQDGSNAPVAGSILAGAIAAAAYMV